MKFSIVPILLLLALVSPGICNNSNAMEIRKDSLYIPTNEIILIWENYCRLHMARGEWHLARLNQKAIEFQKTILWYETDTDQLSHFQKKLEEAQATKKVAGDSWGCNPQKAELVVNGLNIGRSGESRKSDSFLSDNDHTVEIKASAFVDSACQQPKLQWDIAVPKYGMRLTKETQILASTKQDKAEISTNGLSPDETLFTCFKGCRYIVYEIDQNSFHLISKLENSLAIPKASFGDRGADFKVSVEAKLSCNGALEDRVSASIQQDEKDQLRQEYVDMEKRAVPEREELTDQGDTPYFTVRNFNSSEQVDGGQYKYILCKILSKLEKVKNYAGNIPMTINSGFRNPYKNALLGDSAKESNHLYGVAADIRLMDFNHDNKINDLDRAILVRAAKLLGGCVEPKDGKWRVHMDWRTSCPSGW